jgi:ribosomal protein S18 acetylase RimI-like enzyme
MEQSFLTHHLNFAKGRHIQNLVKMNATTSLAISGWIKSPSWNHVIVYNLSALDKFLLNKITRSCELSGRLPALYTIETLPEKKEIILEFGYKLFDTEYWMTIAPDNLIFKENSVLKIKIQPVEEESDVEVFIRAFRSAFNSLEAGYAHQLYLSLIDTKNNFNKSFHIYAVCEEVPVGIGSLYYNKKFAGIYNLAVIPEYQGMGIGSSLVGALTKHAELQRCETIFLQAEITTKKFYEKLGFSHSFSGQIYVKL